MGSASDLKDFFISYTGVDVDWADWIAEQLEAAGYTTVYQTRDFNAGGNFVVQMHQAMRQTKRTIAVLSPEYLEARFTLSEWAEAFRRDPTGEYAAARAGAREATATWMACWAPECLYRSGGAGCQQAASERLVEKIGVAASKPLASAPPVAPAKGTASVPRR